jgi:FkbM family methyltransferase
MNKYIKKIINLIITIIIKIKKKNYCYTSLGSVYGEWTFHNKISPNPTVISCGAGEDISFDVDFLNHFSGKIYLVDPTPRAIKHYNLVKKKFGNKKKINYMVGGNQSVDSYNLKGICSNNLKLIKKAIWVKNQKLKFYEPKNRDHVSFSLYKNKNVNENFIDVDGIDILSIINKYNIKNIEIIKLDVEGAELIIIEDLFNKNVFPRQILFEFDQLKENSLKSFIYLFKFFKLINKFKYDFFYNDNKNNFSIIKKLIN